MPNEETVKVGKYKVKGIYNYKKKKKKMRYGRDYRTQ